MPLVRFILMSCLTLLLLIPLACSTEETPTEPAKLGYDYFPLATGQYSIFQVQRIEFSTGRIPDTTHYQVKEVVGEKFTDSGGQEAYKLYRHYRPLGSTAWKSTPDSIWTAKITPYQALRTENNVTFQHLAFPLAASLQWDRNRYNSKGETIVKVKDWNKPYTVQGKTFGNTVLVEQDRFDDSCVVRKIQFEVFAKGIGLIHQEKTGVSYIQNPDGTCEGNAVISFGQSMTQTLVEFHQP